MTISSHPLGNGTLIADRYLTAEFLSAGGSGYVYKAFDNNTNQAVALKILSSTHHAPAILERFWNCESEALSRLDHANIVRFIDAGRLADKQTCYLVTEFVSGENLRDYLESNERMTWDIWYETFGKKILDALCHAAEKAVTHRDISPGNVVINANDQPILIDFGIAKYREMPTSELTVRDNRTPIYGPPETDSGAFTGSRDAYSFAALSVRAMRGIEFESHAHLYKALHEIECPKQNVADALSRALSLEPGERYGSAIELRADLVEVAESVIIDDLVALPFPFRLSPGVLDKSTDESQEEFIELILLELKETASIKLADKQEGQNLTRLDISTRSFRFYVDIDSATNEHFVVIGLTRRVADRLNEMYNNDYWTPELEPQVWSHSTSQTHQANNKKAVDAIFDGLEAFQLDRHTLIALERADQFLYEWEKVVDALRTIEKERIHPARFSAPDVSQHNLTVTLESDLELDPGEQVVIKGRDGYTVVFRGRVEGYFEQQVLLVSSGARIRSEDIPNYGQLERDWSAAVRAIDRQAVAVQKFKHGSTPSHVLADALLQRDFETEDAIVASVPDFFDDSLDERKRAAIETAVAEPPLLLIHGPPGTGKTKLIVEIVQQELRKNPRARLLVAAQTHIAIDNVLSRLQKTAHKHSVVRIRSGRHRNTANDKDMFTVEDRCREIEKGIEVENEQFVELLAKSQNIELQEIRLAIRATDLVAVMKRKDDLEDTLATLHEEISSVDKLLSDGTKDATVSDELRERQSQLSIERDEHELTLEDTDARVFTAKERLSVVGPVGKEISGEGTLEIENWCQLWLERPESKRLKNLLEIAEDWRLRFPGSEECRRFAIDSAQIVAGTCAGYISEQHLLEAEFDLVVVDEASKATTGELLIPLSQAKRAILVGDHKQLPAVTEYALGRPYVQQQFGFSSDLIELQMFERLIRSDGAVQKITLNKQYRMRGSIGRLVSECFYEGKLYSDLPDTSPPFGGLNLAGLSQPVVWIDTTGGGKAALEQRERPGTSYSNTFEARHIYKLLKRIHFTLVSGAIKRVDWPSIAVISGYRAQFNLIAKMVDRDPDLSELDIECDSVHAFQGREVDICIYSVCRMNSSGDLGFLIDERLLNVAASRPRWHLVFVGSINFCRNTHEKAGLNKVLDFISVKKDCSIIEVDIDD